MGADFLRGEQAEDEEGEIEPDSDTDPAESPNNFFHLCIYFVFAVLYKTTTSSPIPIAIPIPIPIAIAIGKERK